MAMPLTEILTYKHEAINKMKNSQQLLALLSNNPSIDPASDEAATVQEQCFFDYTFADDTFQSDRAVIFVEIDMTRNSSYQFKGLKISVSVVCNKGYADLTPSLWKGYVGNRRDNICCIISDLLEDSDDFGIGDLQLTSAGPMGVPDGFTGYGMVFTAVDFADKDDEYED